MLWHGGSRMTALIMLTWAFKNRIPANMQNAAVSISNTRVLQADKNLD